MDINLHSNKNYIGKLKVANAKKYIITSNPKNGRLSIDQNGKFTYTPKKNFVGKDSFKYKVNNGKINSNTKTVSISVTNNRPLSNNIKINTHCNTIFNGKISATDSDKDVLNYHIVSKPHNGNLTLNNDGTFTYNPNKGFHSIDSFSYKSNDGILDSNSATVTITVTNHPPVADNITIQTPSNSTYKDKLNISDLDGDQLSYNIISGTVNGRIKLNYDGTYTYKPNENFNGTDTFMYKVNNGYQDSNIGTVTILVNSAPIANNMNINMTPNTTLRYKLEGRDKNGDNLRYNITSEPYHGSVLLKLDGKFVYTPNKGFHGIDTRSYKVYDDYGYSKIATVRIVVNNRPIVHDINCKVLYTWLNADNNFGGKDADGDVLRYYVVSQPKHGGVMINIYDHDFHLIDAFMYTPYGDTIVKDNFTYMLTMGSVIQRSRL